MPNKLLRLASAMVWLTAAVAVAAAPGERLPWPDKSGPTFDGHAAAEDCAGVPTTWDEASGKNVAWKIPIEGAGLSTPVIGHGKLWFTSATEDGKQQYVYCVEAASGRVLHHKLVFENPEPEPLGNPVNTYASPSCYLEPDAVYVHFGAYGTARLDPETASVVWQRRDLPCRHFRGPGSSPVVFQDLLILTFDGIDLQYVEALDKRTGKTVWHTPRSTDYKDLNAEGKPKADGDLRKAYHTPVITMVDGQPQLISIGSKAGFGYEPLTGKEIWTFEHSDMNASARPLFLPHQVIVNTGGSELYNIRLDSTARGNVSKSHVNWMRKKNNAKLSSPVVVKGRIYYVTDKGVVFCVDAAKGEELWAKRLGGQFVASPVVIGDLIYFCDEVGTSYVIRAGTEYQEVAQGLLSDGMRASPAVANGALYMRTFNSLYKIAAK
ncbi:MAG: PQQ-binding-like beta-propeller repeat protein [Planctomycetes bacterium]|nr:PQQ-binding-like beta-propeller repeat protein [Planctomycetota bacterium]